MHDLSDGGLAVALAEMAMAGGIGATESSAPRTPYAFGEDQGRYVVTARQDEAARIVAEAGPKKIPVERIGVTGGTALVFAGEAPLEIAELRRAHESFLPPI